MKKVNKKNHIDLSARLHQIWAMIPLTSGVNARKEIKKLIDEVEKGVSKKELKSEIRELLFVHPQWDGNHKITNELVDEIVALLHS